MRVHDTPLPLGHSARLASASPFPSARFEKGPCCSEGAPEWCLTRPGIQGCVARPHRGVPKGQRLSAVISSGDLPLIPPTVAVPPACHALPRTCRAQRAGQHEAPARGPTLHHRAAPPRAPHKNGNHFRRDGIFHPSAPIPLEPGPLKALDGRVALEGLSPKTVENRHLERGEPGFICVADSKRNNTSFNFQN